MCGNKGGRRCLGGQSVYNLRCVALRCVALRCVALRCVAVGYVKGCAVDCIHDFILAGDVRFQQCADRAATLGRAGEGDDEDREV